jgi:hypothetical protein
MTIRSFQMAFWFGRKSVPGVRPFVPAWLTGEGEGGGFARGIDGVRLLDRSSGQMIARRAGAWEMGIVRAQEVRINGQAVVRGRQAAVPNPAGGSVVDTECRAALSSLLAAARAHGLID